MSRDHWKIEEDLCRCCHSEGTFKNLAGAYNFGEEEEIYYKMLRDTLDINITPVTDELCVATYTICDACILRLRDATTFKKQVKDCEQKFKYMYGNKLIKFADPDYNIEVKHEKSEEEAKFADPDYNIEVKHEKPEEAVKCTEEPQMLRDDGDDSFDNNDDSDRTDSDVEFSSKRIKQDEKKKTKKAPQKSKPKSKPKKPPKRCGRPRKTKDIKAEEPAEQKTEDVTIRPVASKLEQLLTEGGKGPKFRMSDDDYKKDGNMYACTRCDKRYDKIFSLKFHVKTKHYKIPRFSCAYCRQEFMTPAPLTVHKLQVHGVDERFKCNACKGTFNTKVQLRKHINNFHMLGEKYTCEACDYESFSFESMYKHKFKHKTVKDYHCRFCRKSFLRKTTLDLHERIHTGDRRKVCAVCGQAFVQKASLNYHMAKYHPGVNF